MVGMNPFVIAPLGMSALLSASTLPARELLAGVADAPPLAITEVPGQQHDGHHKRVNEIGDEKHRAEDPFAGSEAVDPADRQSEIEESLPPPAQIEMVPADPTHDARHDHRGGVALRRRHLLPWYGRGVHVAATDASVRRDRSSQRRRGARSIASHCFTNSTRRFLARPSSVSFGANGTTGPVPTAFRRPAGIPYLVVNSLTTASARRSESDMLCSNPPTLSVCPT